MEAGAGSCEAISDNSAVSPPRHECEPRRRAIKVLHHIPRRAAGHHVGRSTQPAVVCSQSLSTANRKIHSHLSPLGSVESLEKVECYSQACMSLQLTGRSWRAAVQACQSGEGDEAGRGRGRGRGGRQPPGHGGAGAGGGPGLGFAAGGRLGGRTLAPCSRSPAGQSRSSCRTPGRRLLGQARH